MYDNEKFDWFFISAFWGHRYHVADTDQQSSGKKRKFLFHKWQLHLQIIQVTLNSSVNFVIYCIFGDKFKRSKAFLPFLISCVITSALFSWLSYSFWPPFLSQNLHQPLSLNARWVWHVFPPCYRNKISGENPFVWQRRRKSADQAKHHLPPKY